MLIIDSSKKAVIVHNLHLKEDDADANIGIAVVRSNHEVKSINTCPHAYMKVKRLIFPEMLEKMRVLATRMNANELTFDSMLEAFKTEAERVKASLHVMPGKAQVIHFDDACEPAIKKNIKIDKVEDGYFGVLTDDGEINKTCDMTYDEYSDAFDAVTEYNMGDVRRFNVLSEHINNI
jgi:hypothetical protein